MSDLRHQFNDKRLTTAEILYHLPDYPALLQSYIWQGYDLAPRYPVLRKFLDFWQSNLDGALHSVRVTNVPVIRAARLTNTSVYLTLH
ncbi:MAG: usg protein [Kiloniellales bacterium]|nr:usg protein [Kiloniellales bacterium]